MCVLVVWCTIPHNLTTLFPTSIPFLVLIPFPLPSPVQPGAIVAQHTGYNALLGIALCWLGLFGPGILLIFGVLPFWSKFRHWQFYRRYVVCGGVGVGGYL